MSDSVVYLPSASSTESCDTSYSSCREEMEIVSTVQPYEGEPRASNEDFDDDWQTRFIACGVQVKIRTKNSRYWMFSLSHLRFVFYDEISLRLGSCVRFRCHNILFHRTKCGEDSSWSRVSLLQSYSLGKPKANFWRKNQLYHEAR